MAEQSYDDIAYQQRLKAAVHYTVGRICEEIGHESEVTFTKQFIATLAESTFKQAESIATDLELFAKHAKRTTVNADDVKLVVRKCPELHDHINSLLDEHVTAHNAQKRKKNKSKPKQSKRQKTSDITDIGDNSNPGLFED